jgi:hypothetical protein
LGVFFLATVVLAAIGEGKECFIRENMPYGESPKFVHYLLKRRLYLVRKLGGHEGHWGSHRPF